MLRIQEIPTDSIKRDGCLSLLLMFYILGGGLLITGGLINTIFPGSSLAENKPWLLNMVGIVMGGLDLICGVAAWKWKKWGVWGLGATLVIGFVISFSLNVSVNILSVGLLLIQIVLLGYLAQRRWQLFE